VPLRELDGAQVEALTGYIHGCSAAGAPPFAADFSVALWCKYASRWRHCHRATAIATAIVPVCTAALAVCRGAS
jgi:hypothetical protein